MGGWLWLCRFFLLIVLLSSLFVRELVYGLIGVRALFCHGCAGKGEVGDVVGGGRDVMHTRANVERGLGGVWGWVHDWVR